MNLTKRQLTNIRIASVVQRILDRDAKFAAIRAALTSVRK